METEGNFISHHIRDWDQFRLGAANLLADCNIALRDHDLSLIEFEGFDGLEERALAFSLSEYLEVVLGKLSEFAVNDSVVGFLGQDRVCIIHHRSEQLEDVLDWIGKRSVEIDPTEIGVNVKRIAISLSGEKLTQEAMTVAFMHLVDQFANGGKVPKVASLPEAYKALKQFERVQLKAFRCTVLSGGFSIAFQPVVKLSDRKLDHFEALARFEPLTGDSSPAQYLKLAEQSGLIAEFDYAMIREVAELVAMSADLLKQPPIAVNLSAISLSNTRFLRSLLRLLNGQALLTHLLAFEITDSGKLKDLSRVNTAIQSLRQAGASVGLDDFGADTADLNMLSKLQVDYVKIDGRYVESLLETPKAKSFLRAITMLCEDLEIETVAKAVENEATAAFLLEHGVSHGQGHLFGAPRYATSVLMEFHQTNPTEFDEFGRQSGEVRDALRSGSDLNEQEHWHEPKLEAAV